MRAGFLLRRFTTVSGAVFAILLPLYLLRGRGWERSATEALVWSVGAGAIVVATRIVRRRKEDCATCADEPVAAGGDAAGDGAGGRAQRAAKP